MSGRDEKRGGSGCAIGLVLVIMFLPVLYVLGIGPAAWLDSHVPLPFSLLQTAYLPLTFIAENCEPIGNSLDWYTLLWL